VWGIVAARPHGRLTPHIHPHDQLSTGPIKLVCLETSEEFYLRACGTILHLLDLDNAPRSQHPPGGLRCPQCREPLTPKQMSHTLCDRSGITCVLSCTRILNFVSSKTRKCTGCGRTCFDADGTMTAQMSADCQASLPVASHQVSLSLCSKSSWPVGCLVPAFVFGLKAPRHLLRLGSQSNVSGIKGTRGVPPDGRSALPRG
jgi:hypothetical protein